MMLIKRIITIFLSFSLSVNLSACLMMPLMVGTIHSTSESYHKDPKTDVAAGELIQESVAALDGERSLFDRILIGDIEVKGDLISVQKFRQILLETLRSKKLMQDLEPDYRGESAAGNREVLAVLNIQFHQTGNRIWLAQQIVDMRTNRILWSGIYDRPLSEPAQQTEDNTSLTTGS